MTLNLDAIANLSLDPVVHPYDKTVTILYALGLGMCADPMNADELPFVYEGELKAMPSICNVLCHPGFWVRDPQYGIDWVKVLHAEQDFTIHRTIPATGRARGEYRVTGIEDKGAAKGALLHMEKLLYDDEAGDLLATVRQTIFMRGNGGQGELGEAIEAASALPDRAPDRVVELPTRPDQALIYRLSGDWNPLHADPAIATQAGFPVPILHGLCTNGLAARAIVQEYCGFDVARFKGMFVRFSSPVYPGETIRFEFFEGEPRLRFRASVIERDLVVLDRCSADVA